MLRVFMLVYWLASEGLPMLKIYTLAMLIRALDFRGAINCVWDVGRKYVNHMAATEIMMAMAAVLREWQGAPNAANGPPLRLLSV